MPMATLMMILAQFDDERRKRVLNDERLLSEWRGPLIALAVGGFVLAVIGHLIQSKTAIVAGILLVCVALIVFPVLLYARGV